MKYEPHTHKVEVTENRAPTDDSIRLYGEFRDKAIKSILAAGSEDLSIGGLRWTLIEDVPQRCHRLHLEFFVDGRRCECNVAIADRMSKVGSVERLSQKIQKSIADAIASEIRSQIPIDIAIKVSQLL